MIILQRSPSFRQHPPFPQHSFFPRGFRLLTRDPLRGGVCSSKRLQECLFGFSVSLTGTLKLHLPSGDSWLEQCEWVAACIEGTQAMVIASGTRPPRWLPRVHQWMTPYLARSACVLLTSFAPMHARCLFVQRHSRAMLALHRPYNLPRVDGFLVPCEQLS